MGKSKQSIRMRYLTSFSSQPRLNPRDALQAERDVDVVDRERRVTSRQATLAVTKVISYPERIKPLPEDEFNRIVLEKGLHRIQKKRDGTYLTHGVSSLEQAKRDLDAQYERKVGQW